MTVEVLVVDDHAIIRDGLRKILADTPDLRVTGEASHSQAALQLVRSRAWGLVVLDLSIPGRGGLELIRLLLAERPRTPILVFSMHPEEQYAVRAIRAGAGGYLSKETDSDLLLPAMRRVASGRVFISARTAELLAQDASPRGAGPRHATLTDREFGIFHRIAQGASLTEIANELNLSVKTVSTHKINILAKLNLSNQAELVRYAIEHGLLETHPG